MTYPRFHSGSNSVPFFAFHSSFSFFPSAPPFAPFFPTSPFISLLSFFIASLPGSLGLCRCGQMFGEICRGKFVKYSAQFGALWWILWTILPHSSFQFRLNLFVKKLPSLREAWKADTPVYTYLQTGVQSTL